MSGFQKLVCRCRKVKTTRILQRVQLLGCLKTGARSCLLAKGGETVLIWNVAHLFCFLSVFIVHLKPIYSLPRIAPETNKKLKRKKLIQYIAIKEMEYMQISWFWEPLLATFRADFRLCAQGPLLVVLRDIHIWCPD